MKTVLEALRESTRELHAALDSSVAVLDSAPRYAAFLQASLAAVEPLEAQLPGTEWVARAPLLRADLAQLGAHEGTTRSVPVPVLDNAAAVFGARYVIEGSSLGGAVISRSVQAALGADAPVRYLTVHGAELGARWRAFMNELDAWGKNATEQDRVTACDAARAVFACYRAAFERAGALDASTQ